MPDLSGKHLLVLRPKGLAEHLLSSLAESGAKVSHFPMFRLEPWETSTLHAMLDTIAEAQKLVFVSPSAAKFFFEHLAAKGLKLPESAQCYAPGSSTAATIRTVAGRDALCPKDVGDASSILSMEEFAGGNIEGRRIDIIGGESGNHQIIFELLRRGANASYVSCYRMLPAEPAGEEILAAHRASPFSAVVVHSNTALHELLRMLGDKRSALAPVPVVCHHRQIAMLASNEGFKEIVLARNGQSEAIIEAAEKIR